MKIKSHFNRYLIYCLLPLLLLLHFQSPNVYPENRRLRQNSSQDSLVAQGYLPFWNDRYQPDVQTISRLSTVVLAFVVPQRNGSVTYDRSLQENLNIALEAIRKAKTINPKLRLVWAIGGWGNSDNFTSAVSPPLRQKFINNIFTFLDRFNADGLDIDWEFPKASDRDNLTEFVSEFSAEAKKRGKNYQLTMAVNTVDGENTEGLDLPKLAPYLHHFNLMTYDFYGSWSQVAGLHSAAYPSSRLTDNKLNAQASVDFYLNSGVPAQKIVIGVNSHGRIQTASPGRAGDCLGEKSFGHGEFTFSGEKYSDEISYSELEKLPQEWRRFFDPQAQSPYLYNRTNKTFISFDDARSVRAKTNLVKERNLGGIMLWDLPGDADHKLIDEILNQFSK